MCAQVYEQADDGEFRETRGSDDIEEYMLECKFTLGACKAPTDQHFVCVTYLFMLGEEGTSVIVVEGTEPAGVPCAASRDGDVGKGGLDVIDGPDTCRRDIDGLEVARASEVTVCLGTGGCCRPEDWPGMGNWRLLTPGLGARAPVECGERDVPPNKHTEAKENMQEK